jgi:hypothetical protein
LGCPFFGKVARHPVGSTRRSVSEKIGGWSDYRKLDTPPESDCFVRALEADFQAVMVPRLSVLKFPASRRRNVYMDRPCHEQEEWSRRMKSEPGFEADYFGRIIQAMTEEMPEEMPLHKLIRIFTTQIAKRATARFKGAGSAGGIDRHKRFKGL